MNPESDTSAPEKRFYCSAIVAVRKDGTAELLADWVTATSEEEAVQKARMIATEKYPVSEGFVDYHVSVSKLFTMAFITEIATEVVDNAVLSEEILID